MDRNNKTITIILDDQKTSIDVIVQKFEKEKFSIKERREIAPAPVK